MRAPRTKVGAHYSVWSLVVGRARLPSRSWIGRKVEVPVTVSLLDKCSGYAIIVGRNSPEKAELMAL